MKIFNSSLRFLTSIFILINAPKSIAGEIDGIYIPQGKFDSALPTVTMRLDKIRPPVIRIAPSRPTVVIFPNQVSNCFSDNTALITEIANATKLNANEQGVNFSSVVFKVDAKGIINGEIPDQTVVNCVLVDSNVYPIGVVFTDTNAYSVVKLIDKPVSTGFVFDMDGYSAIQIGDNSRKVHEKLIKIEKNENRNRNRKNINEDFSVIKKKKTMEELLKENYPQLKKEDSIIVENKKQKKVIAYLDKEKINDDIPKNEFSSKISDKNVSISELLEKRGFKPLKGELNAAK